MTIVEAIKSVLTNVPEGLTAREIYDEIIHHNLYEFGAKDPIGVVNSQIRRRCIGLDFPTAYPIKVFRISGQQGNKNRFALFNDNKQLGKEQSSSKHLNELPEEKMGHALVEHLKNIRQQVLECVLNNTSTSFEHLVVELLLKMGYGYDEQSGIVTGAPNDGGIDGIISEDKLGLDLIYIQAKRYAVNNKVGRKDLQAFIGAMENKQKGVFITTSSFTPQAETYIKKQQQKNVKLIDGELLSELLVKYEVGVSVAQKISVYKIDSDYFNN